MTLMYFILDITWQWAHLCTAASHKGSVISPAWSYSLTQEIEPSDFIIQHSTELNRCRCRYLHSFFHPQSKQHLVIYKGNLRVAQFWWQFIAITSWTPAQRTEIMPSWTFFIGIGYTPSCSSLRPTTHLLSRTLHYKATPANKPRSQIVRVLISKEMLIWEDTSKLHLVQKQWLFSTAFSQPTSEPTYFIAHQSEEMFIRSSNLSVCTDEAAIVAADLTLE